MKLQDKLIELRKQRGWSQETLADYLDVSRQAVSKWEAGRATPDVPKLIAIAELFNVSLDELLRDKKSTIKADPGAPVAVGPLLAVNQFVYEYKSRARLFGIPLVHIKTRRFGGPPAVAKGIIAIGDVAVGVVAMGGVALGLFCLGGIGLGLLLALGGLAIGGFALGGVALGVFAFGGVAIGLWAMGGCALGGQVAAGGYASAPVAVGGYVSAEAGFLAGGGQAEAFRRAVQQYAPATPGWFVRLCQAFL